MYTNMKHEIIRFQNTHINVLTVDIVTNKVLILPYTKDFFEYVFV